MWSYRGYNTKKHVLSLQQNAKRSQIACPAVVVAMSAPAPQLPWTARRAYTINEAYAPRPRPTIGLGKGQRGLTAQAGAHGQAAGSSQDGSGAAPLLRPRYAVTRYDHTWSDAAPSTHGETASADPRGQQEEELTAPAEAHTSEDSGLPWFRPPSTISAPAHHESLLRGEENPATGTVSWHVVNTFVYQCGSPEDDRWFASMQKHYNDVRDASQRARLSE